MHTDGWDGWGGDDPGDDPTGDGDPADPGDHADPGTDDFALGDLGATGGDPLGGFDDPAADAADGDHPLPDPGAPEEPLGLDAGTDDFADHADGGEPTDHADHLGAAGDGGDEDDGDGSQPGDVTDDRAAEDDPGPDAHPGDGAAAADMVQVGADPDLAPHADDPGWAEPQFPPALDLGTPPQPVDGFPWSDPALLGQATTDPGPGHDQSLPDATADDVAAYAASDVADGDPWVGLLGSDDPATSSLARWWAPDDAA